MTTVNENPGNENNETPTEITPEVTQETNNTQETNITDTPAATSEKPTPVRLVDSPLEIAHAELPPLSNIPSGNVTEIASASDTSPKTSVRHGLHRNAVASKKTTAAAPEIGIVENPVEITENLSGKFANGYGEKTEQVKSEQVEKNGTVQRERRYRLTEPSPSETAESGTSESPREFIPPVSQKTYTAEVSPERARERQQNRENLRTARNEKSSQKREFFGERREDKAADWTPKHGSRTKLTVEIPKIPEQKTESLWDKIKNFFAGLLGKKNAKVSANKKFENQKYKKRQNGNRRENRQRYHNNRGKNYRNDNRNGKNFNRPRD